MGKVMQQEPARIVGQVQGLLFFATALGFQIDGNTQAEIVAGVTAFASIIAGEIVRAHVTPADGPKDIARKVENDVKEQTHTIVVKAETDPVGTALQAMQEVKTVENVIQGVEHPVNNAAAPEQVPTNTANRHPMVSDPESPYATDPDGLNTPAEHTGGAQPAASTDTLAGIPAAMTPTNIPVPPTPTTANGSTPVGNAGGESK